MTENGIGNNPLIITAMRKSISFLLISAMICACNIEEQSFSTEQSPVFTATIEDNSDASSTRIYVDSLLQMHWSEGDQISVFTDSRNRQYQFTGKSGDTKGTFEEVQKAASGAFAAASANYAGRI